MLFMIIALYMLTAISFHSGILSVLAVLYLLSVRVDLYSPQYDQPAGFVVVISATSAATFTDC